jgi:hypothetical protein
LEHKPLSDKKAVNFNVDILLLDNLNPRLPKEAMDYSQLQLALYMENNFDLLPIAKSMSDNGYFDEEPLIVIRKEHLEGEEQHFIVIEGNRRLAALKFLTQPEFQANSIHRETYNQLALSSVENLLEVPAMIYESREQTCAMLGFRHIAGIMKWSSLSKAEFIYNFAQSNREKSFSEIARTLGDQTSSIRRNYATYAIYIQAQNLDIETSKMKRDFSVFYTALGRTAFQDFLGLEISGSEIQQLENPVPRPKIERLQELITWIHGDKTTKPIISDSRQLGQLAEILKSEDALAYLRSNASIQDAFSLSGGENHAIIVSLNRARVSIEQSLKSIYRHPGEETIHESLFKCAQTLWQALKIYPDILTELKKQDATNE